MAPATCCDFVPDRYSGGMNIRPQDIVKIDRDGTGKNEGLDWRMLWRVLQIRDDLAQIDLVRGSLLGPRWELLANLVKVPEDNLGPCQLQASPFCGQEAVMVRLDPMAMAPEDPAPANDIPTCQECFEHRSDAYLQAVAR
jgi:hypothetical protein